MKVYKPMAGESISETCHVLEQMASTGEAVQAEFNDVVIVAEPRMAASELEETWRTETERRRSEYEASPAGKATAAAQDKFRRKAEVSAAQGIVPFDVSDEAAWSEWRRNNEDGGYGEACLRYAARWANMMDREIATGHKLEDIADRTSHEADTEGITGFMYGAAVNMLSRCWRHGEKLRRWHNLKTQIQNEGEEANESGGVLNPAILSLG